MSRRAVGVATEFSRRIVAVIEQLRDEARMTNADLIAASEMSNNYYYIRLRGEAPFNTNDIEKLASALNIDPIDVLKIASEELSNGAAGLIVRTSGSELGRRLSFLANFERNDIKFEFSSLNLFMKAKGLEFSKDRWLSLLEETQSVRVPQKLLSALGEYFDVDPEYLIALPESHQVQRVEAEIDFQKALKATGARAMAARALGDISPNALKAITKSILSIDSDK